MGKIISININRNRGERKTPVKEALINRYGIKGDGHSGKGHRQISLLSYESIKDINKKGVNTSPGDFAENITTEGIELKKLKIGEIIGIGDKVILAVTQIGKECPKPCEIYYIAGYCIMPEEGIFCRVLKPGKIETGDSIFIQKK
ncbi:MAG: MOSC domain-containing protein [Actinobacteria bacterium]|nr:MOSC domain-containing protein [Actinomycetota bacterium]MBL7124372.1 MOSC domain-containing protein [Actinomycetota bacterium]